MGRLSLQRVFLSVACLAFALWVVRAFFQGGVIHSGLGWVAVPLLMASLGAALGFLFSWEPAAVLIGIAIGLAITVALTVQWQ